jgi:hypothetical protein
MGALLPLLEEPVQLKHEMRTLLEQSPERGMRELECGCLIAAPLWDTFRRIVVGYRNELRLWVMGERPWEHCVAGLAGRIERRLPAGDPCGAVAGASRGVPA